VGGATYGNEPADCGTLVVPENRHGPHSRLIALPITRIRAHTHSPGAPIFRLPGGPGLTNMDFADGKRFTARHEVVLVGYRGVDGSSRLDCPEVIASMDHSRDGPLTRGRVSLRVGLIATSPRVWARRKITPTCAADRACAAGTRQRWPPSPTPASRHGRPRLRPRQVPARELRGRRIRPEIARRRTEHGSGLGRARWVVERTFAWLHNFKRLLVRYDRRHEIHEPSSRSAAALSASGGFRTHCDSSSWA
jgi:hypothetical protein